MQQFLGDLRILFCNCSALSELSIDDLPSINTYIMRYPNHWRKFVKRSILDDPAPLTLSDVPAVSASASHNIDASSIGFPCYVCGSIFASRRALSSHSNMSHKSRFEGRRYVRGPQCPVCRKDFQSRVIALQHLNITKCRLLVSTLVDPMTDDAMKALDDTDRQHHAACRAKGVHYLRRKRL